MAELIKPAESFTVYQSSLNPYDESSDSILSLQTKLKGNLLCYKCMADDLSSRRKIRCILSHVGVFEKVPILNLCQ